ncbi:MAG: hypothetical protein CMP91_07430 [Gammaproteobacteria bacterium]|nr:hypothetical protein [Gammaproteobacteria bacterium]|tara:strand:- start:393221 stop:393973 length:753 start_codon:yes stop_codon:yes gene_type:complete
MNKILLAILFSLSLSACGGGGGGASAPVVIPDVDVSGLWSGTFSQDGVGSFELFGLFFRGELVARSYEGETLYVGSYTVNQDNVSGSAIARAFGTGEPAVRLGIVTFQGIAVERSQISLTYTSDFGATGSISVFYDSIYDRESSQAILAGDYTSSEGTVTIGADSAFTIPGIATNGCDFEGFFRIIDGSQNLYRVTGSRNGCDDPVLDGNYLGYATLTDNTGFNDQLIVWFENGQTGDSVRGYFAEWQRI